MPIVDVVNIMVWNQLRTFLPNGTKLTSVRRPAADQLKFIVAQSSRLGYTFSTPPHLGSPASWQAALEFLREKGYKVAAPGRSNHQNGIAYDLSGPNLEKIEQSIRKAASERRITLAQSRSSILREPQNNCVHVEIIGAILLNEQFVDIQNTA